MSESLDLFPKQSGAEARLASVPLAERLRPIELEQFFGLEALDKNLVARLKAGRGTPPSLILWGPPGSGKTTLARLVGKRFDLNFYEVSAVMVGVKEVREIVAKAAQAKKATLLFMDEIHRFNRAQQDAFLPHVESGTIILVGATTENPSFYLNPALLSRCQTLTLPALNEGALAHILARAEDLLRLKFDASAHAALFRASAGDARRLLNLVEAVSKSDLERPIGAIALSEFLKHAGQLYYSREEEHYNLASAFIKSLRGSDPDAALFWGIKMIESGDDPLFVARRMIIFASEDVGNADASALPLALATFQAVERIGLPEGKIPLAQCITYLACAPKSNRSYVALRGAEEAIGRYPRAEVPLHLRNAPTKLMQEIGYGQGYQYAHDLEHGYAPEQRYLPVEVREQFYQPSEFGAEAELKRRQEERAKLREECASALDYNRHRPVVK